MIAGSGERCPCEKCTQARGNATRVYCPRCGREVAIIDPRIGVCTPCACASAGLYDDSEAT